MKPCLQSECNCNLYFPLCILPPMLHIHTTTIVDPHFTPSSSTTFTSATLKKVSAVLCQNGDVVYRESAGLTVMFEQLYLLGSERGE